MKKITKIWGIGLIVVVLVSLFGAAIPVSAADPLQWNLESVPTTADYVLAPGSDVADFSVGGDGKTIFAVTGTTNVYKSVNTGATWTIIDLTLAGSGVSPSPSTVDLVAVAPDDNNFIAIANSATPIVYISINGGGTWGSLLAPQDAVGAAAAAITGIDISALSGTKHYLAVSGSEASGAGNVWYYALGIGGAWKETNTKAGFTGADNVTLAVSFSPNFPSDLTLTAVTTNVTAGTTSFEMFNLSETNLKWNNAGFGADAQYPVEIKDDVATAGSIALSPDFMSDDETERVAFIGLTGGGAGGVYRVKNTTVLPIKTVVDFYSVAFDGTTVVAGETVTTRVWRSDNPLVTSPDVYQNSALKSPGGETNTRVAFAGTKVVAGTTGISSAFAVSTSDGQAFNDISLIDTTIADIEDFAVSADSTKLYVVTNNGTNLSVWYYAAIFGWQRVLSLPSTTGYIVRAAPDNFNVVYVAKKGSGNIYYNKDAGFTKWNTRAVPVTDLAVESADVAYVAYGSGVSKTTNGGSIWGLAAATQLGGIYSLTVISKDNLIAGGTDGYVAYSTNGNTSWTRITIQTKSGGTNLQVTADNLGTGGNIWAGTGDSKGGIWSWKIGQATTDLWKDTKDASAKPITGMVLVGGNLYAASANLTQDSAIKRARPATGSFGTITAATYVFDNTPSSLRASTTQTPGTKLWASSGALLYSWEDTLTTAVPTLTLPANGARISINPISGQADSVAFKWASMTKVTKYSFTVYLDAAATQSAFSASPGGTSTVVTTANLTLMPGVTYYWNVAVASDGPVASGKSETRSFTVEPAPAMVPTIGSPANGGSITATTPAFSWSPVSGTTKYQFQLDTDTTFATPVADVQLTTTGYLPATALTVGKTYFWRVKALEPIVSDWSTIANFSIVAPPAAPAAPAPPVTVTQPAPTISIPPITMPQPTIIMPATTPAPAPTPISTGLLLTVIIIGAVLVIALIVLIVRTRRTV